MTAPAVVDYAHTALAERQRREKARKLARAAWDQDYGPEDVPTLAPDVRRKIARMAGVRPPAAKSTTWDLVQLLLQEMVAWEEARQSTAATALPPRPRLPVPADSPRGWPELAALGPLDDGARCRLDECGRQAIAYLGPRAEPRCAGHPPRAGDWGAGLNWTPKGCNRPAACWCARHSSPIPSPATDGPTSIEGAHR